MATVVLVAGLIPYDSGKTWFTLGAALAARERGLEVGVFKRVAAHNLWYSPKAVRKSLELKLLVGNDVQLYYERGLAGDIGISNPVAIATAPPDPSSYARAEDYMADFEDVGKIAVLSRVYNFGERVHIHHIYTGNLVKMGARTQRLAERMGRVLAAQPSSFTSLAGYLSSSEAVLNFDRCLQKLEEGSEVVFVESFNDAIAPYGALLEKTDLVVIVAPGKAYVYRDVRKVREAAQRAYTSLRWLGFRSKYVFDSTKPDFSIETGFAATPSARKPHREFINKTFNISAR